MQLSYLQSLDASVESIVATATHVALYDFSPSTSQWSRKDVEGSLFLVSTRDGRFFSVGCAIGRADGLTSGRAAEGIVPDTPRRLRCRSRSSPHRSMLTRRSIPVCDSE